MAGFKVNQKVYYGAPTSWSIGGSPTRQRPSDLVWSGVDNIVRGRKPLLRGQAPLVESEIKVTVIVFTEET